MSIAKGELFAILGGSGCGKTTLLRMLAGFEAPTSGTIHIDGVDVTDVPPYDRPVNMMFQSYAVFPHMNVEKNIAYGLVKDECRQSGNRSSRHRSPRAWYSSANFENARPISFQVASDSASRSLAR